MKAAGSISRNLILLILLSAFLSPVQAASKKDILKQREGLKEIQKEVEESRSKLNLLKKEESAVHKKISKFDQRIESNKKVVRRLNNELNVLQKNVRKAEEKLENLQVTLDRAIRRYLGNIRQFYFTTREFTETGWLDPNKETNLERRIVLLSAFASYESDNLTKVSDFLNQTIEQKNQLKGERSKVRRLKQSKETATSLERSKKSRQQKELQKLRRKKTQESDRLITLEQAAREMEMILVRLEKERRKRGIRKRSDEPSFFASLKGQLRSPFKGEITIPFGNSVDKTTNLKSFSPGISIQGRAGQPVYSIAAGSVAYVGDLRGYGNFVIIDHDGIYFTTYAGIARAEVLSGELVAGGTKLGEAGPDGLIKFELRKGREPLDPIKWISIDAF